MKTRRFEPRGKLFEIDLALLEHHRKPKPALLVFEKEALAVPTLPTAAQCRRLHRR
jgi:hypothetical protein